MKKKFTIILMLLATQLLKAQTAPAPIVAVENTYQTGANKFLNLRDNSNTNGAVIGTFNVQEVLMATAFTIDGIATGSNGTTTKAWAKIDLANTPNGGAISGYCAYGSTYSAPKCSSNYIVIKASQLNIRTGSGTSFPSVTKNGVGIVGFMNQCFYVLSSTTVNGVVWFKIQLHTHNSLSQNVGWVNGSSSFVDYLTTNNNDALYQPVLQLTQNLNSVRLDWTMEGKPSGLVNTSFDVQKNLNFNGFNILGNTQNQFYSDNLLPSNNQYRIIARYNNCSSVVSNTTAIIIAPCSPSNSTTSTTVCREKLPFQWNGELFYNGGAYTKLLKNAGGCDSAANLVLAIDDYSSLPFFITGDSVVAVPSVNNYSCQWLPNTTQFGWYYNGFVDSLYNGLASSKLFFNTTNCTSGELKVIVYNNNSCTNTATLNITVVNTLPLKTFVFEARKNENKALLNFKTTDETNINKYEIERSIEGKNFIKIGEIKANNFPRNEYNYLDEKPFEKVNYYRIKTLEKNGKTNYSEVKQLDFSLVMKHSIKIYPNPVANFLNAEFNKIDGIQKIKIFNSLGQLHLVKETINKTTEIIDVSNFTKGFYIIKAFNKKGLVITEKFIKQ